MKRTHGGNSKWQQLGDVCPNNRFEIEEALQMAKNGSDWREEQTKRMVEDKISPRYQNGKKVMFYGELFPSVAACARQTNRTWDTIARWASDESFADVYFVTDNEQECHERVRTRRAKSTH